MLAPGLQELAVGDGAKSPREPAAWARQPCERMKRASVDARESPGREQQTGEQDRKADER